MCLFGSIFVGIQAEVNKQGEINHSWWHHTQKNAEASYLNEKQ